MQSHCHLTEENQFIAQVKAGMEEVLSLCIRRQDASTSIKKDITKILLALSGGPDSTALLAALLALADKMRLEINVAHINHHLRAAESDGDEEFCRQLCRSWNLPIEILHTGPIDSNESWSEDQMRQSRLNLLAKAAHQCGAKLICLAHTQDDQVETILFRLFRGTGPEGLMGMEAIRELEPEVVLIRPMLGARRIQVQQFLEQIGLTARHDSSNDDTSYTRNYLRKELVPLIEERFGGFQMRIEQLRNILEAENDFLSELAESALLRVAVNPEDNRGDQNRWQLQEFRRLPLALSRRVVVSALQARKIEPSFELVEKILNLDETCSTNWTLSLDSRWDIRLESKLIKWVEKQMDNRESDCEPDWQQVLKFPGITVIAARGKAFKIQALDKSQASTPVKYPPAGASEAIVDLSAAALPLVLRNRRAGDVIQPFGMDTPVKLKKYLHTHKDNEETGNQQFLVLADQDEVLWIPGVGLSNKVRVKDLPTHRLSIIELAPDELTIA